MSGQVRRNVMRGVLRLGLLRADGIAEFGATSRGFLLSLAPLFGFVLLTGGLRLRTEMLMASIGLLAPPVLSHLVARHWGREPEWLRYATAFNWSRWAMLLALFLGMLLIGVLTAAGLGQEAAVVLGLLAVAVYGMVLDWFVARVGLALAWWQAAVLVLVVNLGSAALLLGPRLLIGLPQEAAP